MSADQMSMMTIIWESGLVVKLVLISLILASVISWAIALKKKRQFGELLNNNETFLEKFYGSSDLGALKNEAESLPASPFQVMFLSGYDELTKIQDNLKFDSKQIQTHFQDFGFDSIERSLKKGVNNVNLEVENYLSTLASIGSITPFIGLFGTVWGIIDSFTGLASGGATLDAVAPGIAEALIATAVGLAAAIPAVWFYNHFSGQTERLNNEMESFAQDFLNIVERSVTS